MLCYILILGLALMPSTTSTPIQYRSTSHGSKSPAGLVLGILVPFLIVGGLFFYCCNNSCNAKHNRRSPHSPSPFQSEAGSVDLNDYEFTLWDTQRPSGSNIPLGNPPAANSSKVWARRQANPPLFPRPDDQEHPYFRNKRVHDGFTSQSPAFPPPIHLRNSKRSINSASGFPSMWATGKRDKGKSHSLRNSPLTDRVTKRSSRRSSKNKRRSRISSVGSHDSYYALPRTFKAKPKKPPKNIVRAHPRSNRSIRSYYYEPYRPYYVKLIRPFPKPKKFNPRPRGKAAPREIVVPPNARAGPGLDGPFQGQYVF